jgi:hypothetical protein
VPVLQWQHFSHFDEEHPKQQEIAKTTAQMKVFMPVFRQLELINDTRSQVIQSQDVR